MVLNVLIACEESQTVCEAFRKLGHNAFSCDLQPCSGNLPQYHLQGDIFEVLEKSSKWDIIIAHPPCTHLSCSGARHFEKKREDGRQREAIEFFCKFLEVNSDYVAIENPVNIISGNYVKEYFPDLAEKYNLPLPPTQYIQPYEYGDKSRKKTALWLKGLKPLVPTNIVVPEIITYISKSGRKTTFSKDYVKGVSDERGKKRSKTYKGIAEAMAKQWSNQVIKEMTDNDNII